jgi:hypothetical protein
MVFHNPWGLLALISLPTILALHFFRQQRTVRRIGGLHLWEFARIRLPAGRKMDRLIRSLSLVCQLLAALLASLLIAGMDVPIESGVRHYTVILDDSVSMTADEGGSAAERARRFLDGWLAGGDRYTVVTAGLTPAILAGPFAERDETRERIEQWRPEATACDLEAAVNLAGKFVSGDEKILLLTDRLLEEDDPLASILEVGAMGRSAANAAIVFADRRRLDADTDKALATLQSFAAAERSVTLVGRSGDAELFRQQVTLPPGAPVSVGFEVRAVDATIELRIDDDALAADNRVELPPAAIKPVRAAIDGFGPAESYFLRALGLIPYTQRVDPTDRPDLLFVADDRTPTGEPWRTIRLPAAGAIPPTSAALAQGTAILADEFSPLTTNLTLAGALWPYVTEAFPPRAHPLLSARGQPLLYRLPDPDDDPAHEPGHEHESDEGGRRQYRLNLLWDRTNLFRQAAWPMLVQAIVEECRATLPGMAQTNFRQGEPIPLPLEPDAALAQSFALTRDGRPYRAWNTLPPELNDLPVGGYEIRQAGDRLLAAFVVNLLAPAEGDLQACITREPTTSALVPASMRRTQSSPFVFYAMLAAILLLTGMSWIYQDTSR